MRAAREPHSHLWLAPVITCALVALAGVFANLIGEVP